MKLAVVLFNLGGPDRTAAIRPFLLNLFRDPAVLRVPWFVRPWLARWIATRRVATATAIYAQMGGRSPLLPETEAQARALEAALPEFETRCFVAMRYWHPMSAQTVAAVRDWRPDHLVLLPLYPQFSSSSTGSSLTAWREAASQAGLAVPVTTLCCYPTDDGFVAATADAVAAVLRTARASLPDSTRMRVLFSAHGLPEVIITGGDPYQFQVEQSVAAVLRHLAIDGLDAVVCYQSRATPQRWIGPSTEDEVARAGADGVAVVMVPIAFVSEHSETLVELDIEYRELAGQKRVPGYFRVPTLSVDSAFIAALAGLVRRGLAHGPGLCSFAGGRFCPRRHKDCPNRSEMAR